MTDFRKLDRLVEQLEKELDEDSTDFMLQMSEIFAIFNETLLEDKEADLDDYISQYQYNDLLYDALNLSLERASNSFKVNYNEKDGVTEHIVVPLLVTTNEQNPRLDNDFLEHLSNYVKKTCGEPEFVILRPELLSCNDIVFTRNERLTLLNEMVHFFANDIKTIRPLPQSTHPLEKPTTQLMFVTGMTASENGIETGIQNAELDQELSDLFDDTNTNSKIVYVEPCGHAGKYLDGLVSGFSNYVSSFCITSLRELAAFNHENNILSSHVALTLGVSGGQDGATLTFSVDCDDKQFASFSLDILPPLTSFISLTNLIQFTGSEAAIECEDILSEIKYSYRDEFLFGAIQYDENYD